MAVNDSLAAREERRGIKAALAADSAVVSVKANLPGENKNTPEAYLLTSYFARIAEGLGVYAMSSYGGADGRCYIGRAEDGAAMKSALLGVEAEHRIGRLVDMDVTERGFDRSLSRTGMRPCFLCGEAAFVCARRAAHKREELIDFFNSGVRMYFTSLMADLLSESMLFELELTDKFGLVSPVSNGSHRDLNYAIMRKAIDSIAPTLAECFCVGLSSDCPEALLSLLRPIGLRCEEQMLSATLGSNAYKGFIFVGGALLAAAGYALGRGLGFDGVYSTAAKICADMDLSLPTDTFGHTARRLGFGGIRAEAMAGFPGVKRARDRLNDGVAPLRVLALTVGETEDSVLLKRAGTREKYEYYRALISSVDISDGAELAKINSLCESEGISVGGSADILIAAHLMQKIQNLFKWGD